MVAMCFCFSVKKNQMWLQKSDVKTTLHISGNVAHCDTVQVLKVNIGHSYGV